MYRVEWSLSETLDFRRGSIDIWCKIPRNADYVDVDYMHDVLWFHWLAGIESIFVEWITTSQEVNAINIYQQYLNKCKISSALKNMYTIY